MVIREFLGDLFEEDEVDNVNDFKVTRKKISDQVNTPLFKGFRENSVVSVRETLIN